MDGDDPRERDGQAPVVAPDVAPRRGEERLAGVRRLLREVDVLEVRREVAQEEDESACGAGSRGRSAGPSGALT